MIWRVAFPPPRTSSPHSAGLITRAVNRFAVRIAADSGLLIGWTCVLAAGGAPFPPKAFAQSWQVQQVHSASVAA